MHDLNITIVEESTKRISKHLSYIYTRRRTITIEDEPVYAEKDPPTVNTKLSTNRSLKPSACKTSTSRSISFGGANNDQLIRRTVTTTQLPPLRGSLQSDVKIWTSAGNAQEPNYLIQIKGCKEPKRVTKKVQASQSI